MSRPDYVTQEHLESLDNFREFGIFNMFCASQYIEKRFKVSRKESIQIVIYWMKTFGQEDR
jgi:hypothetical protein